MKKNKENIFPVKHPLARMCLWLSSRSLQTSLHPAEDHPQTALTGLTLQKNKNLKNLYISHKLKSNFNLNHN